MFLQIFMSETKHIALQNFHAVDLQPQVLKFNALPVIKLKTDGITGSKAIHCGSIKMACPSDTDAPMTKRFS